MATIQVEFDEMKRADRIRYFVTTEGDRTQKNTYLVVVRARDIHSGSPEFRYENVEENLTNNEDTLTDEAVIDMLNDVLLDGGDINDYIK